MKFFKKNRIRVKDRGKHYRLDGWCFQYAIETKRRWYSRWEVLKTADYFVDAEKWIKDQGYQSLYEKV